MHWHKRSFNTVANGGFLDIKDINQLCHLALAQIFTAGQDAYLQQEHVFLLHKENGGGRKSSNPPPLAPGPQDQKEWCKQAPQSAICQEMLCWLKCELFNPFGRGLNSRWGKELPANVQVMWHFQPAKPAKDRGGGTPNMQKKGPRIYCRTTQRTIALHLGL